DQGLLGKPFVDRRPQAGVHVLFRHPRGLVVLGQGLVFEDIADADADRRLLRLELRRIARYGLSLRGENGDAEQQPGPVKGSEVSTHVSSVAYGRRITRFGGTLPRQLVRTGQMLELALPAAMRLSQSVLPVSKDVPWQARPPIDGGFRRAI